MCVCVFTNFVFLLLLENPKIDPKMEFINFSCISFINPQVDGCVAICKSSTLQNCVLQSNRGWLYVRYSILKHEKICISQPYMISFKGKTDGREKDVGKVKRDREMSQCVHERDEGLYPRDPI